MPASATTRGRTRCDQRHQLLAAGAELVVGELVGAGGGAAHDVGDADAARGQVVAVRVRHPGGRVDRSLDDPGLEQRRVEAVDRVREVRLGGGGPEPGVDADEEQLQRRRPGSRSGTSASRKDSSSARVKRGTRAACRNPAGGATVPWSCDAFSDQSCPPLLLVAALGACGDDDGGTVSDERAPTERHGSSPGDRARRRRRTRPATRSTSSWSTPSPRPRRAARPSARSPYRSSDDAAVQEFTSQFESDDDADAGRRTPSPTTDVPDGMRCTARWWPSAATRPPTCT